MTTESAEAVTESFLKRLEPNPKLRMVFEGCSYALFLLLTMTQLGLLDYYFIKYTNNKAWYGWIAADLMVLAILIWLLFVAVRYNYRCWRFNQCEDANLKYAFIAWFCYSMVLSAKIAVAMRTFADELNEAERFGRHAFNLILSLSALIFLLLVLSHHYTQLNSKRQLYLSYLESSITLDVLDSIAFLGLLFMPGLKDHINLNMEISILFFACFNFVLPTFALFRLRYRGLPRWVPIGFQELYTLMYFLTANVPYLVIRSMIWTGQGKAQDVSGFIIKNVIMIFLGIRELYLSLLRRKMQLELDPPAQACAKPI